MMLSTVFNSKAPKLHIILDKPDARFTSNSIISGRILASFPQSTKVSKIVTNLFGKAFVKFHGEKDNELYKSEHVYVDRELLLWKPDTEGAKFQILNGDHSFPFTFVLPEKENCPPTFSSKKGRVQYKLTATMSIPWCLISPSSTVDLIVIPEAVNMKAKSLTRTKIVTNTDANFKMTLSIPRTANYTGDVLPLSLEIINNTFANQSTCLETGIECAISYTAERAKSPSSTVTKVKSIQYDFKSKSMKIHKLKPTVYTRDLIVPKPTHCVITGNSLIKAEYYVFAKVSIKNLQSTKISIPLVLSDVKPLAKVRTPRKTVRPSAPPSEYTETSTSQHPGYPSINALPSPHQIYPSFGAPPPPYEKSLMF